MKDFVHAAGPFFSCLMVLRFLLIFPAAASYTESSYSVGRLIGGNRYNGEPADGTSPNGGRERSRNHPAGSWPRIIGTLNSERGD